MIIEALKSLLIGIVEGVTEWLPISSTGHMIIVDDFVQLQVSPEFLALFLVVIQIGAILAVLTLYFHKLNPVSPRKTADEKRATWRLWGMVAIGCIPAAIIGILFDDWVNAHFYNKVCVAAMLILYGVVFIVLERRNPAAWTSSCTGSAATVAAWANIAAPSSPSTRSPPCRAVGTRACNRLRPRRHLAPTSRPRRSAACSASPTSTASTGKRR